ncbi:MAG: CDP-2,3-bis-(O-geranylgeranyl)-sn-glycerol synthase [Candidatus Hodarchaeota archaeon]
MYIIIQIVLDVFFIFYMSMWIIFPAYLANAVVVPLSNKRKFHPIDKGKSVAGNRILGDGKTIEGFFLGTGIGMFGGLVQLLVSPLFYFVSKEWHALYQSILIPASHLDAYLLFSVGFLTRILVFPAGAMLGDILGSFIKRRLGVPRGENLPVLDQLDFILGVILFSLPFIPLGGCFLQVNVVYIIVIIVLTPFIHRIINKLAYRLKIKDVAH